MEAVSKAVNCGLPVCSKQNIVTTLRSLYLNLSELTAEHVIASDKLGGPKNTGMTLCCCIRVN